MENNTEINQEVRVPNETRGVGQAKNNQKMFVAGLAGLVGLVLAVMVGWGIVRAYVWQSTDILTVSVAKVLRLPIGKVNDQAILYVDFVNDLRAINNLSAWQATQPDGGAYADMDPQTLSDMVIEKLVGGAVVAQAARDLGVVATEEDIQGLLDYNISQFESEEAFAQEVKNMYGWTLAEYKKNAIEPAVLQMAIEDKVAQDADLLRGIQDKMNGILAELQAGADFAELAGKYSEDNTAAQGGDLGWFGEGEMVPQFEAVAFSLKPGEMSNAVVESTYGFHIIKVDDRRVVEEKDEEGKTVKKDEVKARHIFMAYPGVATYLQEKISTAQIHLYGRIHNPFAILDEENSEVTATTTE